MDDPLFSFRYVIYMVFIDKKWFVFLVYDLHNQM